jgi:hypothetical protein
VATIGVAGQHRSLPLSHTPAPPDPRAGVRRAWLAPLLALVAIGLLPVLGRSLVWLGTAATDTPAREATSSSVPANSPAPSAVPTPSPVAAVSTPAAPTSSTAASSQPARAAATARSAAPSSVAVAPPVVVVPTQQNPDPVSVQPPDSTTQDPTSDVGPSGSGDTSDPGPDDPPPLCTTDCDPVQP